MEQTLKVFRIRASTWELSENKCSINRYVELHTNVGQREQNFDLKKIETADGAGAFLSIATNYPVYDYDGEIPI